MWTVRPLSCHRMSFHAMRNHCMKMDYFVCSSTEGRDVGNERDKLEQDCITR